MHFRWPSPNCTMHQYYAKWVCCVGSNFLENVRQIQLKFIRIGDVIAMQNDGKKRWQRKTHNWNKRATELDAFLVGKLWEHHANGDLHFTSLTQCMLHSNCILWWLDTTTNAWLPNATAYYVQLAAIGGACACACIGVRVNDKRVCEWDSKANKRFGQCAWAPMQTYRA